MFQRACDSLASLDFRLMSTTVAATTTSLNRLGLRTLTTVAIFSNEVNS